MLKRNDPRVDQRTQAGGALLRERSPLYAAGAIAKPLLIGQGANDPRVKQAESDQIIAAMRAKDLPVSMRSIPMRATASPCRKTASPSSPLPRRF